jgi:putative transcriptional regulator
MKRKTLSQTLIDAANELGFTKATVARLKELNIPEVRSFTSQEIRHMREKIRASQGVFAALLNVNPSTIQKWEQGKVRPQNAALRLLSIIDSHGIDILRGR